MHKRRLSGRSDAGLDRPFLSAFRPPDQSRHTWLYTEMVTTGALIHGDRQRFLRFDPIENPLACNSAVVSRSISPVVRDGREWELTDGRPERRLSIPSASVRAFGACLIAGPDLVHGLPEGDGMRCPFRSPSAEPYPGSTRSRVTITCATSWQPWQGGRNAGSSSSIP